MTKEKNVSAKPLPRINLKNSLPSRFIFDVHETENVDDAHNNIEHELLHGPGLPSGGCAETSSHDDKPGRHQAPVDTTEDECPVSIDGGKGR